MKQAYAQDPDNSELATLKGELEDLIKLTKDFLGSTGSSTQEASSSKTADKSSKPTEAGSNKRKGAPGTSISAASSSLSSNLNVGDDCLAKYSGDGKFYPARIVSTSGSSKDARFSVIFKGYDNTELISASDLKPLSDEKKRQMQLTAEEEADKEKRRKKNEKKAATKAVKTQEQKSKQSAWQSFAKKGAKKGISIPGVQGESMFASPNNPHGRGMCCC